MNTINRGTISRLICQRPDLYSIVCHGCGSNMDYILAIVAAYIGKLKTLRNFDQREFTFQWLTASFLSQILKFWKHPFIQESCLCLNPGWLHTFPLTDWNDNWAFIRSLQACCFWRRFLFFSRLILVLILKHFCFMLILGQCHGFFDRQNADTWQRLMNSSMGFWATPLAEMQSPLPSPLTGEPFQVPLSTEISWCFSVPRNLQWRIEI